MSTRMEAAADLRVKFSRNLHQDGREQSEEEMLDDDEEQHFDHGLQQTDKQKQKNLQAKRRNCFRVFKFCLGVFCVLILAGLMIRYHLVSLENNRMKTFYNQLQTKPSGINQTLLDEIKQLKNKVEGINQTLLDEIKQQKKEVKGINQTLLDEIKQLKNKVEGINQTLLDEIKQLKKKVEGELCPELWMRFRCSCYYKSTEQRSWTDSRRFCQEKGADLLVIDSKEEQEFVSKLNPNAESWIGLLSERSYQNQKYEWKWVDGSPLTEMFWDENSSTNPYNSYIAVTLRSDGRWTQKDIRNNQNWICEK